MNEIRILTFTCAYKFFQVRIYKCDFSLKKNNAQIIKRDNNFIILLRNESVRVIFEFYDVFYM